MDYDKLDKLESVANELTRVSELYRVEMEKLNQQAADLFLEEMKPHFEKGEFDECREILQYLHNGGIARFNLIRLIRVKEKEWNSQAIK